MSPELPLTVTGAIPRPTGHESTLHDDADQLEVGSDVLRSAGPIRDIPVPQSPPEPLLLNVAMTFEHDVVHMTALDIAVSAEGKTAQEAFRRLVLGVREQLESFREGVTTSASDAEVVRNYLPLLRYSPVAWFRFVPADQAYYWTHEWQEGEAEADEELRRGEARTFDNPEEALRWLDSPED